MIAGLEDAARPAGMRIRSGSAVTGCRMMVLSVAIPMLSSVDFPDAINQSTNGTVVPRT
jgi:hypothetical protein